ncbi:14972_t:CDS:1, partial [Cetraspora pellucida]
FDINDSFDIDNRFDIDSEDSVLNICCADLNKSSNFSKVSSSNNGYLSSKILAID